MKVVFLCGGIGKRMFPITQDKVLLNFLGKPLLQHQMDLAKKTGFDQFIIVGNPANIEQIKKLTGMISGVKVEFALQKQALGIADALKSAEHLLNEDIIVVNPDDIFAPSAYTKLLLALKNEPAVSYVLGYLVQGYFPGGYLAVGPANELKHIVEKPKPGEEPSNLINILVHLHTEPKKLLKYIENVKTTKDDVYECALDNLVREGSRIRVVPYTDFWAPIKYPWHIFDAVRHFLDIAQPHISSSASISKNVVIEGKVILEDNVRVLENAVIKGPVYIGPNSTIGTNALVRDYSHIGANCVIGYSTEVKSSYVGDGCWFHSSYIGDSIIGTNCSFGAGTVLANFRFDEQNIPMTIAGEVIDSGKDKLGAVIGDNCKTGINASIMPGVKIGPNSMVGPHVCLVKDLEPGKIILAEPHYRTLSNTIDFHKTNKTKRKA